MKVTREKNYSWGSFGVTAGVILIMTVVSFIPKQSIGGLRLKRADILSDIRLSNTERSMGDDLAGDGGDYTDPAGADLTGNGSGGSQGGTAGTVAAVPADSAVDSGRVGGVGATDRTGSGAGNTSGDASAAMQNMPSLPVPAGVVAVEDFGVEAPTMNNFYAALASADKQPVRIAVLGDSFVEGDIITCDLRELLQEAFGGRGIGFVPFSSNLPPNRATVRQSYSDWTNISVMNKNSITEDAEGRFYVSGLLLRPKEGATSTLEGTTYRKGLRNVSAVRLLFTNEGNTTIDVVINDSIKKQYRPESSGDVQMITVDGNINSIATTFTDTEGFWGYGMAMNSERGVVVDNYSIRGNAGYALYQTSSKINRHINSLLGGYDLVIVQYGQNVLNADQLSYNSYAENLAKIVNFVKGSFPGSSIMVMSVGDRSSRETGELGTMPAVHGMIRAQRKAASDAGVAFWNTFLGMGGENSMVRFVEYNWAAKDYTHISYAGGKHIAKKMVEAIMYGKSNYDMQQQVILQQEAEAAYDALLVTPITDTALPGTKEITE